MTTPEAPALDEGATDWQPISTMPEGIRVESRRTDCPGHDTTAVRIGEDVSCASWFLRRDGYLLTMPTHWRHIPAARGAA